MNIPVIPDYTLEACCGSGAYGDVWTAKDRSGIRRAVKILDRKRLERLGVLQREEKAIKLFRSNVPRHPGLVEIYHVGETEDYIYYVMDLADNMGSPEKYVADTLDERLKKGPMAMPDAKKLLESMLDAVECLHLAGLVHRDIKPSNIIFVDGSPRLADIGLVRSDTVTVSVAGTLGFMAPDGSSGSESDLYSLGKLLYCAITGRSVDAFPSLPDFPESADLAEIKLLNKVILKACDKEPANRFHSVCEFMDALHGRIRRRLDIKFIIVALVVIAVLASAMFFTIVSLVKNREISRLMADAHAKQQAGDLIGAIGDVGNVMALDPGNTGAKDLRNELTKQRDAERNRKMSRLVDEARAKGQAGDVTGAIKDTGSILEIDPDNKGAKTLRSELIRQKLAEKPETLEQDERPLTQEENKEFLRLYLFYTAYMEKDNYSKAIEMLDTIEQKWPFMKQRKAMQDFRKKAQDKMDEAKKAADGG